MRAATPERVRPRWRSRPSWALRVQLTDSMIWRRGRRNRCPGRAGSELLRGVVPTDARMGHHQPQRSDRRHPDVLAVLGVQIRSEAVGDDELVGQRHRGIMITHDRMLP